MPSAASSHTLSPRLALLAIGIGAFGIGTTEFAPMGLLPTIAQDIGVSIPVAGQLITAYAVGVMISAPFMTLYLARFGRRRALMLTMGIYILGNLVSTFAPEYWSLMLGRLLTSLCQGAFFGFGAVTAISLVPPERRAGALAIMFMGTSIANIGGVPASTWLGDTIGWRAAFAVTVAIGVIALIALARTLPETGAAPRPNARQELKALLRPQMLITLSATVLFASAFFAVYTYIAPFLREIAGFSAGFVTLMLMLIGLGLTLGNWLGGKLADRSLERGALQAMFALAATSLALPFLCATPAGTIIGCVLWSASAFACVPALQMRAMQAAAEAPSMAAAMNIAAFNLGNAVGAAVGGAVIGLGLGVAAVPVAGALIAMLGLAALRLENTGKSAAFPRS